MDTEKTDAGNAPGHEADANRKRRMTWEAVMIAQADALIAAGRVVDEAPFRDPKDLCDEL